MEGKCFRGFEYFRNCKSLRSDKLFFQVIAALLELHRLESSGFTAREEAAFQHMCSVVAQGLLPHVNNCLRLLYPLQQISLITGVPVTQLQREVQDILMFSDINSQVF